MTDRAKVTVATYGYRADPAHYLETVHDALGVRALRASYDPATKRLSGLTDAADKSATFGYTLTGGGGERAVQTVTTAAGTSTVALDARGNPVRAADTAGQESRAEYGDPTHPDLPTRTVQVVGQLDGAGNTETDDLYTDVKYHSATGLPELTTAPYRSTDPADSKAASSVTYNALNLPEYVTDPLGNSTYTAYDANGNPTLVRSAEGVTSEFEYDDKGNLKAVIRGGATSRMDYDAVGQVKRATDPSGNVVDYTYDANGNREATARYWYPDPANKTPESKVTLAGTVVYDANDRVESATDERNNTTTTEYDALGRVKTTVDARGVETLPPVYDRRGLAVESVSPDGTRTRTVYDDLGRVVYATDPFVLGQAEPVRGTHTVYEDGRVAATERLEGLQIGVTIDSGFGTSELVSAGTVVSRSVTHYDAAGRVDWTEQYAGTDVRLKTGSEFDSQGRVIRSVTFRYDPATQVYSEYSSTKTEYDKAGRVSKSYDAFGVWTVPTYDADGRVTRTTLQDGTWAETAYDAHGRKERETVVADWAGEGASKVAVTRTTNYGYDPLGRLESVLQPAVPHPVTGELVRPETRYGYNAYGQQVSITDANGRVTAFGFDRYGRQTSRTLPDDGNPLMKETETTAYTKFGEVDYAVDFNGTKVDYVYDYEQAGSTKFGRVTAVTWTRAGQSAPEEVVAYTYDAFGRPDTVTETRGSVVRVTDTDYDDDGRVAKITRPEGVIQYGYDDRTGRHIKTWTAHSEWGYGYDWLGRLVSVTDEGSDIVTVYGHDALGNVTSVVTADDGVTVRATTNTYHPVRHWLDGVAHRDAAGNVLSGFTYTRRADGQVAHVDEAVRQPDGTVVTTAIDYTYDALNRLTREEVDSSVAGQDYVKAYTLDLVGNRTRLVEAKEGQAPTATDSAYNPRDQLVSETTGSVVIEYDYDSNGSLVMRAGGGTSQAQTWDARGRLSGATVDGAVTSYAYTADGIRSGVTENGMEVKYVIDAMTPSGYAQVVEESAGGVLAVRYTYGAGLDPLAEVRGGAAAAYLGDGHSEVRQAVGAGGAVLLVQRFDAFGATITQAGSLQTPVGYRGERFDATLGQYYLRARFYDPMSGRFTAMDPWEVTYYDPMQSMRYGYAGGNPVSASDPSGMFSAVGAASGFGMMAFIATTSILFNASPVNAPGPGDPTYGEPEGAIIFGAAKDAVLGKLGEWVFIGLGRYVFQPAGRWVAGRLFGGAADDGYRMGFATHFPGQSAQVTDDLFIQYAGRVPRNGTHFDLYVHALDDGVAFARWSDELYQGVKTSMADIVLDMVKAGWKPPQPIRVFSCSVGNPALGAQAPAQQLANLAKVEVMAPTEAIHIFRNGHYVINNVAKATTKTPSTGTWKTFKPQ